MRLAPLLRARVAFFAMFGIFMLPVAFSSLRGLTHVLTCEEESDVPFTMVLGEGAGPTIITSNEIRPNEPVGFCDGLSLDMRAGRASENKIEMIIALTNRSHSFWKGSVGIDVGSQNVPISIGAVPAKSTRTETVRLNLGPGVHDLAGTLFVGP